MKQRNKKDLDVMLESLYKLKKQITSTVITLKLESETHVPDLMTKIRVLPSVAVVGQKEKVERYMDGDAMLSISVKFLPRTSEIYRSLKILSTMIKRLQGVKSISVDSYNKRKITFKGSKIVF